ncbi:hypothetical protein HK099_003722 [Clydaea vesicula]|uniref:Protein kinase domain-containing protein n=1 Tax=Clydaea vesicula TaxID=447962 RepID=A0AAD5XYN9_9FUNG|nr:hypothetical protein HK099_003722 [Clydaea vesicula]
MNLDSLNPDSNVQYFRNYKITKVIGSGAFGKVKLGKHVESGEKVALKYISNEIIRANVNYILLKREILVLKLLSHPHIAKFITSAREDREYVIVMEFVEGKDLFEYINTSSTRKDKLGLDENIARHFFRQLLSAVDYIHRNFIVHRDLKPENILIDNFMNLKIIDFGFANLFNPRYELNTVCGSTGYLPPEMIKGEGYIGPEVDIWCLGIILYAMLTGKPPFPTKDKGFRKTLSANFQVPSFVSQVTGYKNQPPRSYFPIREHIRNASMLDRVVLEKMKEYELNEFINISKICDPIPNPSSSLYHLIKEKLLRSLIQKKERLPPSTNAIHTSDRNDQCIQDKLQLQQMEVNSYIEREQIEAEFFSDIPEQKSRALQNQNELNEIVKSKRTENNTNMVRERRKTYDLGINLMKSKTKTRSSELESNESNTQHLKVPREGRRASADLGNLIKMYYSSKKNIDVEADSIQQSTEINDEEVAAEINKDIKNNSLLQINDNPVKIRPRKKSELGQMLKRLSMTDKTIVLEKPMVERPTEAEDSETSSAGSDLLGSTSFGTLQASNNGLNSANTSLDRKFNLPVADNRIKRGVKIESNNVFRRVFGLKGKGKVN